MDKSDGLYQQVGDLEKMQFLLMIINIFKVIGVILKI